MWTFNTSVLGGLTVFLPTDYTWAILPRTISSTMTAQCISIKSKGNSYWCEFEVQAEGAGVKGWSAIAAQRGAWTTAVLSEPVGRSRSVHTGQAIRRWGPAGGRVCLWGAYVALPASLCCHSKDSSLSNPGPQCEPAGHRASETVSHARFPQGGLLQHPLTVMDTSHLRLATGMSSHSRDKLWRSQT